ncbi:MAG: malate synthase A, partial [Vibrio gallaecicus]
KSLFEQYLSEEFIAVKEEVGEERFLSGRFEEAAQLMAELTTSDELTNFLTVPGYDFLE